jgi:hypothetical protein
MTEHHRRWQMSKTHCDIATSLDGFITGPTERIGNPLGDDDGGRT